MNDITVRSRHPGSMKPAFLWAFLPTLVLLLIAPFVGNAGAVTDITSSGLGTDVPLLPPSDGVYDITGGTRPGGGSNLFHSFGDFSIDQGDIANFLNDSGLTTTNIIGRVTGGNISDIDGIIQTSGFGNANLFLVNPSGIVFGPHGSFNVGGSVSFATAQYLRLFDGVNSANFYANPANDGLANSVFAMAPVVDFGFLSPAAYGFLTAPDPSATITVLGSTLSVLPGQSISLVGGDISIQAASLRAQSGHLNLVSVASPGEVLLSSFDTGSFATMGTVTIEDGALLDVSGQLVGQGQSGTVLVRGGQLVMDASMILANTVGAVDGARTAVDIQVSHDVALSNGSLIITKTSGPGRGGDVQLIASTIQLDGASIQSVTTGDGHGGDISIINAQSVSLTNGAQIVSDTQGRGAGGNITIAATNTDSSVTITGSDGTGTLIGVMNPFVGSVTSGVFSTASGEGHGGQITIKAPNVTLDSDGTIATFNSGVGAGGDIAIKSTTVKVGLTREAWIFSITGLDSTFAPVDSGDGGNITIQGLSGAADSEATLVTLSSGALITSIAGGPSNGGDIFITSGDVQLDGGASIVSGFTGVGDGGNITVNVGTLSLANSAAIKSLNESVRLGQGGDITVQGLPGATNNAATLVTLSSGANITSITDGPDRGGHILITSGKLELDGDASSINSATSGSGDGGNITAKVDSLKLMNFASISSKTSSLEFGRGGDITVQGLPGATNNAATSVTLTDESRIATEAFESGDGGQVAITSKYLTMDNSIITTATDKTGDGGDIVVNVLEARLSDRSKVFSTTKGGAGEGGSVTVQGLGEDKSKADSFTVLNQSGIISTSTGEGRLGNIEVYAKTVSLTDVGVIQVGTQQDTGRTAGEVVIVADSISISGDSSIRNQVQAADAGQVTLTADRLTLDNGTIEVSTHGIGDGGNVVLNVGSMSLANGSTITSSSFSADPGAGDAGDVSIMALGAFTSNASTIATSAEHAKSGDILINAQSVLLSNGTLISANSNAPFSPGGEGDAGNVTIISGSNVVMQNSSVTTEASRASGGSIEINASDAGMIQLTNSKVSTSVGGVADESDGGNITIDPQFVILQNSQIIAQAFAGAGGAINIIATSAFIANPASIVSASSTLGISGTINIQSPLQNVGEELTPLSEEFSNAAALLAQQCAARAADGKFSTFVVAAREGLPVEPGGFLASPSLTAELVASRFSERDSHHQLSAVTGLFPQYAARPIQLAKLGNACHQ